MVTHFIGIDIRHRIKKSKYILKTKVIQCIISISRSLLKVIVIFIKARNKDGVILNIA
jgi:hypothetical protein